MHVSSADDIHDWAATAKPGDTLVYWTGANLAECRHRRVVMQLAGYAAPGARAQQSSQPELIHWRCDRPAFVVPVQRRVPEGFAYEAQRTRLPWPKAFR
jgi:hypothetical protein